MGWHLKDGAQPEIVKEFEEYKRQQEGANKKGAAL